MAAVSVDYSVTASPAYERSAQLLAAQARPPDETCLLDHVQQSTAYAAMQRWWQYMDLWNPAGIRRLLVAFRKLDFAGQLPSISPRRGVSVPSLAIWQVGSKLQQSAHKTL